MYTWNLFNPTWIEQDFLNQNVLNSKISRPKKKAFQVKLTVLICASVKGSHTNKNFFLYFWKDSLTNRIGPFIHTILDCDKSCSLCLQHYCPSFPRIWKTKQKTDWLIYLWIIHLCIQSLRAICLNLWYFTWNDVSLDIIKHARFPNWKHGPDPRAWEVYKNSLR